MTELGIDISEFNRVQFNEDFLNEYDVVVAMAKEHQNYIQNEYKERIPLFNEICEGKEKSVVIRGMGEEEIRAELRGMVDYMNSAIPRLLEVLRRDGGRAAIV